MKALRSLPALLCSLTLAASTVGCTDSVKVSEDGAAAHADELAKLIDADVQEIRTGLPQGGQKLGVNLFDEGPEVTPAKARRSLKKTREAVTVLQLAKATFFAVTDMEGVAWANDQETDGMSGKNLLQAFPGLEKAKSDSYVESMGFMEEAKGVRTGPDEQWVAAAPIIADGVQKGVYVTGWSMRRFTYHLEEQLKSNLRQAATKSGNALKTPLVYAFVIKGDKVFGALTAPEVNVKAIEDLKILEKLPEGGTWKGRVEITNRTFGVAAKKTPSLCSDCAVAVLRSEV